MEQTPQKLGKLVIGFAAICLVVVMAIIGFQLKGDAGTLSSHQAETVKAASSPYDHKGSLKYRRLQGTSQAYLAGGSSERTLAGFYERRQYPGSPPLIIHPIEEAFESDQACLSCHEKGGWVAKWERHTPVTPHPENLMCRQCHVSPKTGDSFVAINWQSIAPPRLGASQLPGAPPVFPHTLQMREDCIACHTGPGAVTEIRTNHAIRGDCRQCHMPLTMVDPFRR